MIQKFMRIDEFLCLQLKDYSSVQLCEGDVSANIKVLLSNGLFVEAQELMESSYV